MRTPGLHMMLVVLSVLIVAGCRQEMADQPRIEPYEVGAMFEDSLAMRKPVPGTVPRNQPLREAYRPRPAPETALSGAAAPEGSEYPFPITERVLRRGQQRFNIFCSPCHGRDGYGAGIIVQRGLRKPPSFHADRLRQAPASHFYSVITDGYGAMYSYAGRVEPADRWAITAYIQALQMSQNAAPTALPGTLGDLSLTD